MGLSLYGTHKVQGNAPTSLSNIVIPSFGDSILIVAGSGCSTTSNPNGFHSMIFQSIPLTRIVNTASTDPSNHHNYTYLGYMFPTSAGTSNLTICWDYLRQSDSCITAFVYTGAKQEAPHTTVQGSNTTTTVTLSATIGDIGNLGFMMRTYLKVADYSFTWDDGDVWTTETTDDYDGTNGFGCGLGASTRIVTSNPWPSKVVLSGAPAAAAYGAVAFKHIPGSQTQIVTAL